jgi:hypothetical protein
VNSASGRRTIGKVERFFGVASLAPFRFLNPQYLGRQMMDGEGRGIGPDSLRACQRHGVHDLRDLLDEPPQVEGGVERYVAREGSGQVLRKSIGVDLAIQPPCPVANRRKEPRLGESRKRLGRSRRRLVERGRNSAVSTTGAQFAGAA